VGRVEIRRHSVRDSPAEGLSPRGRALAEYVGERTGPFREVITSPRLRAVETAIGMHFPPTSTRESWAELGAEVSEEIDWPAPFVRYAALLGSATRSAGRARELGAETRAVAEHLGPGESALIVTHGGLPELTAVGLFPETEYSAWGDALRCLEGVSIQFERARPVSARVLRVPDEMTRR
jgi:Histidine phosphatase superfamily (branch 1)